MTAKKLWLASTRNTECDLHFKYIEKMDSLYIVTMVYITNHDQKMKKKLQDAG